MGTDRINFGSHQSFNNYPTGKTVITYIPLGCSANNDPSYGNELYTNQNTNSFSSLFTRTSNGLTASNTVAKILVLYYD